MNSRIKQLRVDRNLTLEEFGNKIGVTRAAVSKWENGDRGISDSMVVSICREFGVNEHWLRTGEGSMFSNENQLVLDRLSEQYNLNEDDRDVLAAYLQLTPEQRNGIKAYISILLQIKSDKVSAPPPFQMEVSSENWHKNMAVARDGSRVEVADVSPDEEEAALSSLEPEDI